MVAPPTSFVIVIDTREQLPFSFPEGVETVRGTLHSGDYSVKGLEDRVAVERKSLADLYGSVTRGRERFEREIQRLSEFEYAMVVIEASWVDLIRNPPPRTEVKPRSVVATIIAWESRYGVPFHAYGPRSLGAQLTFRTLERFWMDAYEIRRKRAP